MLHVLYKRNLFWVLRSGENEFSERKVKEGRITPQKTYLAGIPLSEAIVKKKICYM